MSTNPLANITPIESETFVLTAANNKVALPYTGEFLIVQSADEAIEVAVNRGSRRFPMGANSKFRMPTDATGQRYQFDHIEFRRKAGAVVVNNTVVVIIGSGDFQTGSTVVASTVTMAAQQTIRQTAAATLSGALADVVLVAATNTLLFAAAAAPTEVRCRRIRNNGVVDVRVATLPADLTAGRGEIIAPGTALETHVSGDIYARSAGTPTLNLSQETF